MRQMLLHFFGHFLNYIENLGEKELFWALFWVLLKVLESIFLRQFVFAAAAQTRNPLGRLAICLERLAI